MSTNNAKDIVQLWRQKSINAITQSVNNKIQELLESDELIKNLIEYENELKSKGYVVERPFDFYKQALPDTQKLRSVILENASQKYLAINNQTEEMEALLKICEGNPEKEMEILCSYKVVEYPFGRMVVEGEV